ncbi:MAG: DUF2726 domain-containing protein [Planctomycetota bacterium]
MFEFLFNHWPIVFVASATFIAWGFAKLLLDEEKMPYQKRPSLLTDSQLSFYKALHEAVNGDWAIQSRVRLSDLLHVEPNVSKAQTWQNRIAGRDIDFILCDQDTLQAKLAIKLDDPPEEESERSRGDRFVDQAFNDAGLPLLRIDIQASYDAGGLRKSIDQQLVPPAQ